ncbi:UNVERIFIED_CONTAM: hypothetical protein RMT77_007781 [Armadillidium vulgare]
MSSNIIVKNQLLLNQCFRRIIFGRSAANRHPWIIPVRNSNMADNSNKYEVIHDKDNHEFYIKIGDDKAHLQYEVINNATGDVDLLHTEVPQSFRGKGVAKILAKEALDYFAIEQKVNFKLTCWYLQKYVNENNRAEYEAHTLK